MERCPLPITTGGPFDPSPDKDIFWDGQIPDECYRSLMRALMSSEVKHTYYNAEEEFDWDGCGNEADRENIDKYIAYGIQRKDDSPERYGVEEYGIQDDAETQAGTPYRKTEVDFTCRRD